MAYGFDSIMPKTNKKQQQKSKCQKVLQCQVFYYEIKCKTFFLSILQYISLIVVWNVSKKNVENQRLILCLNQRLTVFKPKAYTVFNFNCTCGHLI